MQDGRWEGWYSDPFGRHEARWMSNGKPTKLVRDSGVESSDPPPDEPFAHQPEPLEAAITPGPDDVHRADERQQAGPFDNERAVRVAFDNFDRFSPGHP
jgi:hypothetical protein